MSRSSTLILLGLLIVITPFSGLPTALRTFLLVLFGALVVAIAFLIRSREVESARAAALPQTVSEPEQPTSPSSTISAI